MGKQKIDDKILGHAVCAAIQKLIGDNSPCPEIRKAWFDSFSDISRKIISGQITMKEAKKLADKKKEELTMIFIYSMLKHKNKEIRDIFEMCLLPK